MDDPAQPYLVFFYTMGNRSCLSMRSVLKQIYAIYGNRLPCLSIDVNRPPGMILVPDGLGAPALQIIKNHRVIWEGNGLIHSSELSKTIEDILNQ